MKYVSVLVSLCSLFLVEFIDNLDNNKVVQSLPVCRGYPDEGMTDNEEGVGVVDLLLVLQPPCPGPDLGLGEGKLLRGRFSLFQEGNYNF